MSRSTISDNVLNILIGTRLEAGVSGAAIRNLIDEFAAADPLGDASPEIAGFLWVEDIPHNRRAEFLAAVSGLSADPDAADAQTRRISANEIWPSRMSI